MTKGCFTRFMTEKMFHVKASLELTTGWVISISILGFVSRTKTIRFCLIRCQILSRDRSTSFSLFYFLLFSRGHFFVVRRERKKIITFSPTFVVPDQFSVALFCQKKNEKKERKKKSKMETINLSQKNWRNREQLSFFTVSIPFLINKIDL